MSVWATQHTLAEIDMEANKHPTLTSYSLAKHANDPRPPTETERTAFIASIKAKKVINPR
jgi:hypothetical protein